jgi:hypothetical protein
LLRLRELHENLVRPASIYLIRPARHNIDIQKSDWNFALMRSQANRRRNKTSGSYDYNIPICMNLIFGDAIASKQRFTKIEESHGPNGETDGRQRRIFETGLQDNMLIDAARAAEKMYFRRRLDFDYLLRHGDSRIYMPTGPPAGKEKTSIDHNQCLPA